MCVVGDTQSRKCYAALPRYCRNYALKYCGAHSGRGEDKWSKAGLTPATRHGIPYPDEANLVFLCRKMAAVPIEEASFTDKAIMHQWYGDHDMHTMYVGEIIEVAAR